MGESERIRRGDEDWIGGDDAVDGRVPEAALDDAGAPEHGLEAEPGVLQRSPGRGVVGVHERLRALHALQVTQRRGSRAPQCRRDGQALAPVRAHQRDPDLRAALVVRRRHEHRAHDGSAEADGAEPRVRKRGVQEER